MGQVRHIAVAPEAVALDHFDEEIKKQDIKGLKCYFELNGRTRLTLIC